MTAPPITPSPAAATKDSRIIRSTGTPISRAAVMFSDVARRPRPSRVRMRTRLSAATAASIAPITQKPWVGMDSPPTVTGLVPENWLTEIGVLPQIRKAAPWNAVSRPPIIMSRLECEIRVTAGRITVHSMMPTAAQTTAREATKATGTGRPALCVNEYITSAPNATNAPWARLSAPLTLNTSE